MDFTPSSIAKKILERRLADEERKRKEKERSLVNSQLRKAALEHKENEFRKNLIEDDFFFDFAGREILVAGLKKWESVLFIDDDTLDVELFRRSGFDVYKCVAPNPEWLKHAFPDSLICFDELRLFGADEFSELPRIHSKLSSLFESYFPVRWKLSQDAKEIIDLLDLEIPSNNATFKEIRNSLKKIILAARPFISRYQEGERIPEIVDVLKELDAFFEEKKEEIPILEINWNIENSENIIGDRTVDKAFCFFNSDFLRWISAGTGNQFFMDLFSHVERAIENGSTEIELSFPREGKNGWYDFSGEPIPHPPSSIMGCLHALGYDALLKSQREHFLIKIQWAEPVDFE